jgi:hypothetical protein
MEGGKTFDASTFSLGKHFLSLFLSPHFDIIKLHFLSPSCEYNAVPTGSS